ncbi:MAG: glycosyltransferase, partial [Parafilimonas sp.]
MRTLPIIFTLILTGAYSILILIYYKAFVRLKIFKPSANINPVNSFSIIIPARNEEENIRSCIVSIFQNNYPSALFEVIVVDDFSTDKTIETVRKLQQEHTNLQLINLADRVQHKLNSYKKKAIETAIGESKHEWIITTDADCLVKPEWLQLFDAYIQTHRSVFIAAPVIFSNTGSFVSIFQCLDFMSLQGITAASVSSGFHSMCNGANLAYKKNVFYEVGGFKGVDAIASGDDMLLMHKIKMKHPKNISYLFNENVIVTTSPMPDWNSFINQRIRWASKSTNYNDKRIFMVLVLVYFFNLFLFMLPFFSFVVPVLFLYWLILIALKTICELFFLIPVSRFFNQQK